MAENLYMEIWTVIEWPFKDEDQFIGSIVDVAKAAKELEGKCLILMA
jgi:hypothetical protein